MSVVQVDAGGRLRHLLTLDGLPRATLEALLDRAQLWQDEAAGGIALRGVLAGRAVCTLFVEPSTRTASPPSAARLARRQRR